MTAASSAPAPPPPPTPGAAPLGEVGWLPLPLPAVPLAPFDPVEGVLVPVPDGRAVELVVLAGQFAPLPVATWRSLSSTMASGSSGISVMVTGRKKGGRSLSSGRIVVEGGDGDGDGVSVVVCDPDVAEGDALKPASVQVHSTTTTDSGSAVSARDVSCGDDTAVEDEKEGDTVEQTSCRE